MVCTSSLDGYLPHRRVHLSDPTEHAGARLGSHDAKERGVHRLYPAQTQPRRGRMHGRSLVCSTCHKGLVQRWLRTRGASPSVEPLGPGSAATRAFKKLLGRKQRLRGGGHHVENVTNGRPTAFPSFLKLFFSRFEFGSNPQMYFMKTVPCPFSR